MSSLDWLESVFSDGSPQFVTPTFPVRGDKLKIRIRVYESAAIKKIWLKSFSRGSLTMTVARKSKTVSPFVYYTASISSSDFCLEYCFVIQSEDGVFHYNQAG